MKKGFIITLIIILVLAALAVGFVMLDPLALFAQPIPTEPAPTQAPTEPDPTEAPTEPEPTEAPTEPEPTEPPFQMEVGPAYGDFLYGRELSAGEYFVYDLDRDRFVVRTGNETERAYPASITKLYTALVALQYLDPQEEITVGNEIFMIDEDSSVAELQYGDVLTVEQLISGMMLPSGNDATQVVAVTAGRKLAEDPELNMYYAVDRFVTQMNEDREKMGLTGSHFVTVDGMHSGNHYISFQDFVTIGRLAMENDVIAKSVETFTMEIPMGEDRSLKWKNSNMLLDPESRYYCSYITGLKTGFTTPAGNCLLSYAQLGEKHYIIGVLECLYPEDRFADTLLLLMRVMGEPIPAPQQ